MVQNDVLEPDIPIIDAHHHLWMLQPAMLDALESDNSLYGRSFAKPFRHRARYLFEEFERDCRSGHNIVGSVYVECGSMYRTDGPECLRSLGEVEFANGIAAMSASGAFGPTRICHGIVGSIDLSLGSAVEDSLGLHMEVARQRYCGVRSHTLHDSRTELIGDSIAPPFILRSAAFQEGVAVLGRVGLALDLLVFDSQLEDVLALSRKFPGTTMIINHAGLPTTAGEFGAAREERFQRWRTLLKKLASSPNIFLKLGGFGMPFAGFAYAPNVTVIEGILIREWRPLIETCIEIFGPKRCMFESNFPVDSRVCSYSNLWTVYKTIVRGASVDEKRWMFANTATQAYKLPPLASELDARHRVLAPITSLAAAQPKAGGGVGD